MTYKVVFVSLPVIFQRISTIVKVTSDNFSGKFCEIKATWEYLNSSIVHFGFWHVCSQQRKGIL